MTTYRRAACDFSKICKLFNWDKMMRKVSVIIKSSRIANKRLCTLLYSQLSRYEADMKEKKLVWILMKQLMDATGSKQLLSRIREGSEANYEEGDNICSLLHTVYYRANAYRANLDSRLTAPSSKKLLQTVPPPHSVRKKVKIRDCARKILGCQSNQSW